MDARVRRFALLGAAVLLLLLCLYPFVLPPYRNLVVAASRLLLSHLSHPIALDVLDGGAWRASVPASDGVTGWTFTMDPSEFGQEVAFLGLAILPALVWATPAGVATRLRLLVVSLVCLFVLHTLSLSAVILIIARYCHGREGDRTCGLIAASLSSWSHIATFGLWGALTWRHWFGSPGGPAAPGSRRRR